MKLDLQALEVWHMIALGILSGVAFAVTFRWNMRGCYHSFDNVFLSIFGALAAAALFPITLLVCLAMWGLAEPSYIPPDEDGEDEDEDGEDEEEKAKETDKTTRPAPVNKDICDLG